MGVLSLAGFCLSACNRNLDVQQAYGFTIEAMPVQKNIVKGQTAEIRCTLKREGYFADTRYTIRYFQPDGKGTLRMDDGNRSSQTTDISSPKRSSVCITHPLPQIDKPLTCM